MCVCVRVCVFCVISKDVSNVLLDTGNFMIICEYETIIDYFFSFETISFRAPCVMLHIAHKPFFSLMAYQYSWVI